MHQTHPLPLALFPLRPAVAPSCPGLPISTFRRSTAACLAAQPTFAPRGSGTVCDLSTPAACTSTLPCTAGLPTVVVQCIIPRLQGAPLLALYLPRGPPTRMPSLSLLPHAPDSLPCHVDLPSLPCCLLPTPASAAAKGCCCAALPPVARTVPPLPRALLWTDSAPSCLLKTYSSLIFLLPSAAERMSPLFQLSFAPLLL